MMKTMELLGAKPVPISANERYMALQTKVVDAAENNPSIVLTEKEYEVTNFYSLTGHFITPNVIALDGKYLKKMPEDLQKIVLEAGKTAADFATKLAADEVAGSLKALEQKGMKVNLVTDQSSFIEKVKPIYGEYTGRIGQDIINKFLLSN
jgi:TRAP-type C4-dicarboxylate transport system substrate-binding protein